MIAVAVVFSVGCSTNRTEAAACSADARTLAEPADAYVTAEQIDVLPTMGVSATAMNWP